MRSGLTASELDATQENEMKGKRGKKEKGKEMGKEIQEKERKIAAVSGAGMMPITSLADTIRGRTGL